MLHQHIHRTYVPDGIYFVTTDVRYRIPYFTDLCCAKICEANMWNTFYVHKCDVFAYVIMPDHLHLLIQPSRTTISRVMQSLKTNTARDINRYLQNHSREPGLSAMGHFTWQQSFYDHVIRDDRDFHNHIDYIRYNPVKAGLVEKPEEYPFLFVDDESISRVLAGS